MSMDLIPLSDRESWDRVVTSFKSHDTYHLSGYHVAARISDGGDAWLLHVRTDASQAALPMLVRPIPGTDGLFDATSAYGYPGALADVLTPNLAAAFSSALREVAVDRRLVSLFVRQNPFFATEALFEGLGETQEVGPTVAVDLSKGESLIWQETRSQHRRHYRKASRLDPEFVVDRSFASLGKFVELYEETMTRNQASPYYFFPRNYFVDLIGELGDSVRLMLAKVSDEVVSAALFFDSGQIVQYHLGGTSNEWVAPGMSRWLLEQVRRWAVRNGRSWYHLGGGVGSQRDSLFDFKTGFGPDRGMYRVVHAILDRAAYVELSDGHNGTSLQSDSYFPAYRR